MKTFLTAISFLLLTSCAGLRRFPAKSVFETDTDNGLCVEYEITDPKNLRFREKARHPIERCNGVFGFDPDDVGRVNTWIRDAIRTCQNCRQQNLQLQMKLKGMNGDAALDARSNQDATDKSEAAACSGN